MAPGCFAGALAGRQSRSYDSEKKSAGGTSVILSRSVVRSAQHGVMVKVSQRRPYLARHQRNEDADRQIETGIRLDADMAELVQRVASLRVIEND